jgi:hypothetical protein
MIKKSSFLMLAAILLAAQPAFSQNYKGGTQYGGMGAPYGTSTQIGAPYGTSTQIGAPYGTSTQLGSPYQRGQYVGTPYAQGYYNPGYTYGQYPYANVPAYGYYGANPYNGYFPALGAPVPVNGGLFRFNVGGFNGSYWKSPSGYYYPWGAGAVYTAPPPIIIVNQGSSQPTLPPVSDMLRDMSTYIEEQNTKKKFKPDDYQHLARRVRDLQSLESSKRGQNAGVLDPTDEERFRKDCAMLSGDISRRVIP